MHVRRDNASEKPRRRRVTLRGLLILVAVCGLLIATVLPAFQRARIASNETATIGMMHTLSSSEAAFQSAAIVDQDGDGTGEFGWLQELGGHPAGYRVSGGGLSGLAASPAFGTPVLASTAGGNGGVAQKSGYSFQVFLPTKTGPATAEAVPIPTFPPQVGATGWPQRSDANEQERRFACYAWPASIGNSGNRAFVVSQQGEVFSTANKDPQHYTGTIALVAPFSPGAAFVVGVGGAENPDNLEGLFMEVIAAKDGYAWVPAGN